MSTSEKKKAEKPKSSRGERVGLTLSVSRIDRRLRASRIAKRVGGDVAYQVAAYAEAVVKQILEDAGQNATNMSSKKLTQVHIAAALRSNPDLARLYSAFSITSMNDMPKPLKYVHSKKDLEERKKKAEKRKMEMDQAKSDRTITTEDGNASGSE